jgi:hypothetical protein
LCICTSAAITNSENVLGFVVCTPTSCSCPRLLRDALCAGATSLCVRCVGHITATTRILMQGLSKSQRQHTWPHSYPNKSGPKTTRHNTDEQKPTADQNTQHKQRSDDRATMANSRPQGSAFVALARTARSKRPCSGHRRRQASARRGQEEQRWTDLLEP